MSLLPGAADDSRKVAKRKMQGLPNSVFEELAMDVHDEVDRRETDAVWAAVESVSATKKSAILPFLPVNPDYGEYLKKEMNVILAFSHAKLK